MIKKLAFLALIIIAGLVLLGFARQIYETLKVSQRLDDEVSELVKLQQKNTGLKKKLGEMDSIGFIESQARNKLNMARPNETVVIIPEETLNNILGVQKSVEIKLSNWQGWLKLFWK